MGIEYKIYTLADPENGNIFYVGVTVLRKLRYRLIGHKQESKRLSTRTHQYIAGLLQKGLEPIIEEIETIPYEACYGRTIDIENYWITQFKAWGFNLTNHKIYYNRFKLTHNPPPPGR